MHELLGVFVLAGISGAVAVLLFRFLMYLFFGL